MVRRSAAAARPAGYAPARRRRRLWPMIGVLVAGIAAAAIALAASGSRGPHFSFGAVSVVSSPAPKPVLPASDRGSGPPPFRPAAAAVALAAKLSLPAQVAQLFVVSDDGPSGTPWGGVVLTSANSPTDAAAAASSLQGGVAPLVAATQEGGPETAFPTLPPEGEATIGAALQPAALARAQAELAGTKLRALGVNMTLAPLADVDTPGGALTGRLFGTDPALVARLAVAAVEGYAAAGEISAVGHFPGPEARRPTRTR